VTEQLTRTLAVLLRASARLVAPDRRPWAEALQAEAGQVPAGWGRLHWLAGGLWLVAREANVARKVVYWVGVAAAAAVAAWTIWLSWRAVRPPYYDPPVVTDRIRVVAGIAAFVVLPWVGRRRGWFGPVGSSIIARLVRVAGCAAMCGLGVVVVRMDSHLQVGANIGPFSLLREIAGLALLGAISAVPVIRARWPRVDGESAWMIAGAVGVAALVALPVQVLTIVYVAGILAATSRRSPIRTASLAAGVITGVGAGAVMWEIAKVLGDIGMILGLIMLVVAFVLAILAGLAASWLLPANGDPKDLRDPRIRQGLLAGAIAGAACGVVLTYLTVVAVFMMVLGPLAGAVAGMVGGAIAADRPRRSLPDGSGGAGLFVLMRDWPVPQAPDP
jgi:hypothetical protein